MEFPPGWRLVPPHCDTSSAEFDTVHMGHGDLITSTPLLAMLIE